MGSEEVAGDVPAVAGDQVERLCRQAFGHNSVQITGLRDINGGRGAFSVVIRATLDWGPAAAGVDRPGDRPASVVAKLPIPGPNGAAAAASGAYYREALAYREILADAPLAHPRCWMIVDGHEPGGTCQLLLEDLGDRRMVDQVDGLAPDDAVAVATSLARFHRAWDGRTDPLASAVRRNTVGGLASGGLDAGLLALEQRWSDVLDRDQRSAFARLRAAHAGLADRFGAQPVTLCHGDPRADNLAFDPGGAPILFDWQQTALQFGEADLAWLAATSLTIETRRAIETDLVAAAGGDVDRYRLGLALPGLAVLFLAQRELTTDRGRRFVAASLQRIAAAIADNETAALT